jgi:hypothetical protein
MIRAGEPLAHTRDGFQLRLSRGISEGGHALQDSRVIYGKEVGAFGVAHRRTKLLCLK